MKKSFMIAFLIPLLLTAPVVTAKEKNREDHISLQAMEDAKEIDQVLFLVQKRLAVMHAVARWKWNTKTEIEDLPGEAHNLKKIGKLAAAYGLEKNFALSFFQAQMEASKLIQQHDFESWTTQGISEFENTADYHTEIKPYLDRLTKELMQALVDMEPLACEENFPSLIPRQPISTRPYDKIEQAVWEKAVAPLYDCTH